MKTLTARDVAHAARITLCPIGAGRLLAFAVIDLDRCPADGELGIDVPSYVGYAAPEPGGLWRVLAFDASAIAPGASPEAFHVEAVDLWHRDQLATVFREIAFGKADDFLPRAHLEDADEDAAPLPPAA